MATLIDIARAAKLSVTTVSQILRNRPGYNAATRRRVFKLAQRLHYCPNSIARQLRGMRSNVLGAVIGADNAVVNFDRLSRLEQLAFKQGYRLMIGQVHGCNNMQDAAEYMDDFRARGVAAVIWLHQPPDPKRVAKDFFKGMPATIFLDKPLDNEGYAVRIDYADGIRQAVRHLVGAGRQRIGLALDNLGARGNPMAERLRGYREEMAAQGQGFDEQLVWTGEKTRDPMPRHVQSIIDSLIGGHRADAILASNDIWAAAMLKALRQRGLRVPEQVAVVGFDNLDLAHWTDPELTTIDQQHVKFAQAVMDLIPDMIEHRNRPVGRRCVVVKPQLVVRSSA